MHSFVPTLFLASLAALSSAVPIARSPPTISRGDRVSSNVGTVDIGTDVSPRDLTSGVTNAVDSIKSELHLRDFTSEVTDVVDSIKSELHLRDFTSEVTDAVDSIKSELHLRANVLSVSTIFTAVEVDVQPYTQKLTYLTPSNGTVPEITSLVSSIKTSLETAISQLKALNGQDPSVILAPVNPTGADGQNLTVPEIAAIVAADVKLILGAVGQVLTIGKSEGGVILTDVDNLLEALGTTVTELVTVVDGLLDGLVASLGPMLVPVKTIAAELGLETLITLLDL